MTLSYSKILRLIKRLVFPKKNQYFPTLESWMNGKPRHVETTVIEQSYKIVRNKPAYSVPADVFPENIDEDGSFYINHPIFLSKFSPGFVGTRYCEVLTPDLSLIGELLFDDRTIKQRLIETNKLLSLPRIKTYEGEYATIFSRFSYNYAYWLTVSLPRLLIIEKSGRSFDKLVLPKEANGYHVDFLGLLGIPKSKILFLDNFFHKFESLLVPNFPNNYFWLPNTKLLMLLRDRLLSTTNNSSNKPYRRLYVSRKKDEMRRIINEDLLLKVLNNYGFEEIIPQEKTIQEQISLFKSAKVIIGPFGAGLANMVFLPENATVIELVGSKRRHPHLY